MERRTRPPDVEEALSSMLWTPYERTPSATSSDEGEASPRRPARSKGKSVSFAQRPYSMPYFIPTPHLAKPPSYENFVFAKKIPASSINSLPYSRMPHSFTDNFVQYQDSLGAAGRFSAGDFGALVDLSPLVGKGERVMYASSSGCHGDLHFSKCDTIVPARAGPTPNSTLADLPSVFGVSKPRGDRPSVCASHGASARVVGAASVASEPSSASGGSCVRVDQPDGCLSRGSEQVARRSDYHAMRFSVPATDAPEGAATVFVADAPRPSLTIHVNQSDQEQDVVNQPSGVSIVNCYRAVPVQLVSSAKSESVNANECARDTHVSEEVCADPERTFTSTEAQTDDLPVHRPPVSGISAREQRRRERRERRQARSRSQHIHPHGAVVRPAFEILPDILNSHLPPPYSTLPLDTSSPPPPPLLPPPLIPTIPVGPVVAANDTRYVFPLPIIRRSPSERSGKGCCGQWFAGPPLRALIAVVALGGVACAIGGAALGATGLAGPPSSHLTAALLMIGVGIILVTVSGAAWRMTAPGAPPCLGLGTGADFDRCGRRPCSGRGAPHGLLYPEFQHRPPPPSYQASMQEYRLRLLLLDRDRQAGVVRGASPPPTYRSDAGSLLRPSLRCNSPAASVLGSRQQAAQTSEHSLPPSYRARSRLRRGGSRIPEATTDVSITPEQQQHQQQLAQAEAPRVSENSQAADATEEAAKGADSGAAAAADGLSQDDLVTIVTISGSCDASVQNATSEMDILAHL
ncbi:uncharacterized protein LOC132259138 [Phlebotomus argentipes]|uniref:uncharacterized protein LOC132259138 n=1 Tax=Phlebotomus argentipes TaxID=94469 RepID=UPI002892C6D7|nr:uncharacterized protein LOC132259138 [Phlebotomus argentipes]